MKSRIGMILVIAVFVASPITAWLVYTGVIDYKHEPGQGNNYGKLVHPARPLDNFELADEKGGRADKKLFDGLWTLLEIADTTCTDNCRKNIYKMRQVRLALGKDAPRVQRMILASTPDNLTTIMSDNPGTLLFSIIEATTPLLRKFPDYIEGDISSVSGRIYIIDPLGNLMMMYPDDADPSKLLKDVRKLLKATWIRPKT